MEDFDGFLGSDRPPLNDGDSPEPSNEENENDGDQNHSDEEDVNGDSSKTGKAAIWKHFSVFVGTDGIKYAKCRHTPCEVKYQMSGKSNSSTGNLVRHMKRKHPEIISIEIVEQEEAFVFSQDKFRQALLKWVVMCDQPLNAPNQQAFVDLVNTLNPLAHIISDKTLKADLMVEYEKKNVELKTELSKVPGKISITLDGWTSKNGLAFLAIRGHWLDEEWKQHSKLLDFAYVEGSHDGHNHSLILRECLDRLNIPFSKVFAITADNAGSNDTLFKWLEDYGISAVTSQVRCLAHVLNLAVQDMLAALRVPSHSDPDYDQYLENEELPDIDLRDEIDDVLEEDQEEQQVEVSSKVAVIVKMRTLIKKIRKSTQLRQKLNKLCIINKVKYLVPIVDVKTRWNSSNHMINRAEHLTIPLEHLCLNEKSLGHLRITASDWAELQKIKSLLAKFDRATKLISMARHPTIPSYLPTLDWLIVSLRDYVEMNLGCVAVAVSEALTKLEKYEVDINVSIIPYIATFLQPALKLNYFKEQDKYSNLNVRQIQKTISEYFEKEYVNNTTTSKKRKRDDSDDEEEDDELSAFMFKRSKIEKNSKEINKYLNLPLSDKKVKVLDYWKGQEATFPFLAKMARDVFPAQSGSVCVERDFAGAVDVVTPTRCSLTHKTIRATMCVKSWLKSN